MDSHPKSSTISRIYHCCCNFFVKILDDLHDFVSECVSFPRKINNPFCGRTFFIRKVTIFIGRETKIHIFPTQIDKKFAEVSPFNKNYSFRIILPFNNNNTIWRGSVLTCEELPSSSGELKHALLQAGGPTQSQLSRPTSSGHHISMEHRLRKKQVNSDTYASNKTYLKEIQEKEKKKLFSSEKMKKENEKH